MRSSFLWPQHQYLHPSSPALHWSSLTPPPLVGVNWDQQGRAGVRSVGQERPSHFTREPLFLLIVVSAVCRQADTRWQANKRDGGREKKRQWMGEMEGGGQEWTLVIYINMHWNKQAEKPCVKSTQEREREKKSLQGDWNREGACVCVCVCMLGKKHSFYCSISVP